MPNVSGYSKVAMENQRQDKRNAVLRGMDNIAGLLTFAGRKRAGEGTSQSVTRRYSFSLRAGHKAAYLCTEKIVYHYVENLDAPKKWFKSNVDTILKVFGEKYRLQREDLYFVIGTLDIPNYALFVSHNHPDGMAHFNVYLFAKSKQPWGTFATDTEALPGGFGGSSVKTLLASKVSNSGGPWNMVLVARLRFKPDTLEPMSL
ncbi:tkl tkl-ccin protein kinase [Moniliophthora roreri MCA 2997]|uniref:Tkl tkl-ccin protein kinase n=2 Tax=Moniliophthora roreri TaxID=221103 RepID=V2WTM9_MONRO|nr:tkl tkl-ccin protein kinase [Moniliophthora roreri MCA 2997]